VAKQHAAAFGDALEEQTRAVADLLTSTPAEHVTLLTLNRPDKRNALSIELRDAISAELARLVVDEATRVVVITGAAPAFCAGFDLAEFEQASDAAFARRLWASSDRFHATCLTFGLPLVAAVNGAALAGGFDLAVMCDLRVAAQSARFAHPERTWGDVVYTPLHDLVGGSLARDLALTGRTLTAPEAHGAGLVNRLVPDGEAVTAAVELASTIAQTPREILLRTKAKIVRRAAIAAAGATLDL
jgi:enoyl-CoA hydratase